MVARIEDCFLGKLEPGFGASNKNLLLSPWKWSGVGNGQLATVVAREPPLHNASSFFDASRSGVLPTWTSHHPKQPGLHNSTGGDADRSVQPHLGNANSTSVSESHDFQNDSTILTSFVSSYLMAHSLEAASSAATTLAPGRAGVVTTTALAPVAAASHLARNPSFESINNTGSCSTPSFCVGSPATVFPSRPSDHRTELLGNNSAFSESRVINIHASPQSQLSDHYLSNDSLSYGSMEADHRDAIVDCVDDFWEPGLLSPETFRFEPAMQLDVDTADTGSACGLSFSSVGELDSLVSPNNEPSRRGLSSMTQSTDFCQSFFAPGVVDDSADVKPIKPTHLAIPARSSILAALNGDPPRLRWSDEPWMARAQFPNGPSSEKLSPTGSSPSSPTTPLDPHLFAGSSKLTDATATATATAAAPSNKRSFAAMQSSSSCNPEKLDEAAVSLPLRLQGGGGGNADKFDAAALSALLYSNTHSCNEFRSSYSFKDTSCSPTTAPAPKQRRRHGTATDPQSIAARTRREKFTDRIRVLQSLVPNGERLDTVHMLSQTFEYVRFLQHKVWDLYNGKDSIADVKCEKWKEFVDTTTGQVIV